MSKARIRWIGLAIVLLLASGTVHRLLATRENQRIVDQINSLSAGDEGGFLKIPEPTPYLAGIYGDLDTDRRTAFQNWGKRTLDDIGRQLEDKGPVDSKAYKAFQDTIELVRNHVAALRDACGNLRSAVTESHLSHLRIDLLNSPPADAAAFSRHQEDRRKMRHEAVEVDLAIQTMEDEWVARTVTQLRNEMREALAGDFQAFRRSQKTRQEVARRFSDIAAAPISAAERQWEILTIEWFMNTEIHPKLKDRPFECLKQFNEFALELQIAGEDVSLAEMNARQMVYSCCVEDARVRARNFVREDKFLAMRDLAVDVDSKLEESAMKVGKSKQLHRFVESCHFLADLADAAAKREQ